MTSATTALPLPDASAALAVRTAEEAERLEELSYIRGCARGDEAAMRWLLDHYRTRVVRLAAHVLHNPREAEDVAQDAFIKAFKQIRQFRQDSGFYAWLYRIVVNLCLDRMRRKSATSEVVLEDAVQRSSSAPEQDVVDRTTVAAVLATLSPTLRTTLVLREVQRLEYSEIADVLHIPVGTVRSRLNAAREQFRRKWLDIQQETNHV